jgi:hypothetical protein
MGAPRECESSRLVTLEFREAGYAQLDRLRFWPLAAVPPLSPRDQSK